jgi:5-methylcytosine-specific restriction endonuclease McrA
MTDFVCSNCNFVSKRKQNVVRHIKTYICWTQGSHKPIINNLVKNVICKFCNHSFETTMGLSNHINYSCKTKRQLDEKKENEVSELNKLKEEFEEFKKNFIKVTEDNSKLKGDNSKLKGDNSKLKGDNSKLKSQITDLKKHIKSLNEKNQSSSVSDTSNRKIPNSVRYKLWYNTFSGRMDGQCKICKKNIEYINFHASHIISIKNGGTDNIINLICLCPGCNMSMSSMNYEEYISRYYNTDELDEPDELHEPEESEELHESDESEELHEPEESEELHKSDESEDVVIVL